jgi:glycosyltransferase involved in cell wall biosynthesis
MVSVNTAAMPLVSILIPAFNHERFVQRCLDSVLEDPYPSKELIIIDDGSTDSTGERITTGSRQHSGDLPIEYVRRENKGIAATLNELAARANVENFFAWVPAMTICCPVVSMRKFAICCRIRTSAR